MKKLLLLFFVFYASSSAFSTVHYHSKQLLEEREIMGKEILCSILDQLTFQADINWKNILELQSSKPSNLFNIKQKANLALETIFCKPINTIIPLPESISSQVPSFLYDLSIIQLRYADFITINDLLPIDQNLAGIQIPKTIYIDSRKGDGFVNMTSIETEVTQSSDYSELVKAVITLKFALLKNPQLATINFGIKFDTDNLIEHYTLRITLGEFIKDYLTLPTYDYNIKIYPEKDRTRTVVANGDGILMQETINYNETAKNGYKQVDNISYENGVISSHIRTWAKTDLKGETTYTETQYYSFMNEQANDSIYLYTEYEELISKIGDVNIPSFVKTIASNEIANNTDIVAYTLSVAYPEKDPVILQTMDAVYVSQDTSDKIRIDINVFSEDDPGTIESTTGIDIQEVKKENIEITTSTLDLATDIWSESSRSYIETNAWDLINETLPITHIPMQQMIHTTKDGWFVSLISETVEYSLYNVTGNLILNGTLTEENNFISTTNLPKGIYLLHIENCTYKLMR